jgi:hypothetical protein
MIKFPHSQSRSDAIAWLNDGWFTTTDGRVLRFCDVEEEGIVQAHQYDDDGEDYRTNVHFDDVRLHWPLCGSINLDKYAVHLVRRAARQWSQTYRPSLVDVVVPDKWHLMKRLGVRAVEDVSSNQYRVVKELFNPTYYSIDEAMMLMEREERESCAINPYVIIQRKGKGNTYSLFHRGTLTATLVGSRVVPYAPMSKVRRLTKHLGGRFVC